MRDAPYRLDNGVLAVVSTLWLGRCPLFHGPWEPVDAATCKGGVAARASRSSVLGTGTTEGPRALLPWTSLSVRNRQANCVELILAAIASNGERAFDVVPRREHPTVRNDAGP